MTTDIAQRRAMLRAAAESKNVNDVEAFAQAVKGASEEERAALAKTLPPSRLFTAEGNTPRANFVLAALGKPELVAQTLAKPKTCAVEAICLAIAGRSDEWMLAYCDAQMETLTLDKEELIELTITQQAKRGLVADSLAYLTRLPWFIEGQAKRNDLSHEENAQHILQRLTGYDGQMLKLFWKFFEVEGMGGNYTLNGWLPEAWDLSVVTLCKQDAGIRARMLDESLGALLRDFSAKNIAWYLRVHRVLEPTQQEIFAMQGTYIAVLATAPSTAVGLAQDMLLKLAKEKTIDIDALIGASPVVLARTEKKLIKAQFKLLTDVHTSAEQGTRISRVVAEALDSLPLDLVHAARKLLVEGDHQGAELDTNPKASSTAEAIIIPGPRTTTLKRTTEIKTPIASDQELFDLIAEQLEATGHGADLPRILDYVAAHPQIKAPQELQSRAKEIITSIWDSGSASPRRLLALVLLGERWQAFRGNARHVVFNPKVPAPEGVEWRDHKMECSSYDVETGGWKLTEIWNTRSGYQYLATHSPKALLVNAIHRLHQARTQGEKFIAYTVIPPQTLNWERRLDIPGEGEFSRELEVIGEGPKPFWMATNAPAFEDTPAVLETLALDVSPLPAEFTFRLQEAREQDGYDQIVQWTAWLLQHNPDVLAAQFHPILFTAIQVVNVRGLGPLLSALGASLYVPNGPVYSALALAASAKMPEQRAQAAEAVAQLCDAGLLDPEALAAQIGLHLADGFVLAGRLAQTLSDVASISALSGYRTLQILGALLPDLIDAEGKPITQAGKLIELTAHLARDFGRAVSLPEPLASRSKGASSLAVALRALAAVQPQPTSMAEAAAEAARHTHEQGRAE